MIARSARSAAVVDEDPTANPGTRVNFDPGEPASDLAQQASRQGCDPPEPVTDAVQGQGMQPRIAEQDLERATRRWIPFLDDRQVGSQRVQHRSILLSKSLTEGPSVMHDL